VPAAYNPKDQPRFAKVQVQEIMEKEGAIESTLFVANQRSCCREVGAAVALISVFWLNVTSGRPVS
jgi:hypothetical protein